MGLDLFRSRVSVLFVLSLCLYSCSNSQGDLVTLLNEKYAHLSVNDHIAKKKAIDELQKKLSVSSLHPDNIFEIQKLIHALNDGHVVLFENGKEVRKSFGKSPLVFFPGSSLIKSCEKCRPPLQESKYQILEVDDVPLRKWLQKNHLAVAASSPWGRRYRLIRTLLGDNMPEKSIWLKVEGVVGRTYTVEIKATEQLIQKECVALERLDSDLVQIKIKSLWCDKGNNNASREEVFNEFKRQWDFVTDYLKLEDKIILDLRENGGGSDLEVQYVTNTFFNKKVFMDKYRYLNNTHPGVKKYIARAIPFAFNRWGEDIIEYTNYPVGPRKRFIKNPMVVLISAGCFSSCETLAAILKNEERAKLIGSTTHGGSGDPQQFPISGTSYSINLPVCLVWQKNQQLFEGKGVAPDKEVWQHLSEKTDSLLRTAILSLH